MGKNFRVYTESNKAARFCFGWNICFYPLWVRPDPCGLIVHTERLLSSFHFPHTIGQEWTKATRGLDPTSESISKLARPTKQERNKKDTKKQAHVLRVFYLQIWKGYKGKVVSVVNYVRTIPWRRMVDWKIAPPRSYLGTRWKFMKRITPCSLYPGEKVQYELDRSLGGLPEPI
jgi:hypothetical protein